MKSLLLVCTLILAALTGCSQNHFNVPTENFASKVKSLGVAPIIVDRGSDIRHPKKEQLVALVTETNRRNEQQFVRKLKSTGNFYTVVFLDGDSESLFDRLFFRRETRDDATIQYNKYFWKNDELKNYIQKNNLDAVMLVVIGGLTKRDKVTSVAQMKSMTSDYNHLILTAQILDVNGTILWEYPNFRQRILSYEPIINLEYPDFSEAEANLSPSANVKFRTIEGIRRILEQKRKDMLLRETRESDAYGKQFEEILSLLKYDPEKEKAPPQKSAEMPRSPIMPEQPVRGSDVRPAVDYQPPAPPKPPAPPATDTPAKLPPSDEVVPARGSTL